MKLLIITQEIDKDSTVLGFFHEWVEEFSSRAEHVSVVCLRKGRNKFPKNVSLFTLGKEDSMGENISRIRKRFQYIVRFYAHIFRERKNYDTVFVHMNQEYILLGGPFFWLFGKRIFFWYNHPKGTILTTIAVFFAHRVFYTSSFSYTGRFKKSRQMPVGVDTSFYRRNTHLSRAPNTILSLGRISPVKKVHTFVAALKILDQQGIDFRAFIVGNALRTDFAYFDRVKRDASELVENGKLSFERGVKSANTVRWYNKANIFVNMTPKGSFDKTIIEAASCENIVLACNGSLVSDFPKQFLFKEEDANDFALKLSDIFHLKESEQMKWGRFFREYAVREHSLELLMNRFFSEVEGIS